MAAIAAENPAAGSRTVTVRINCLPELYLGVYGGMNENFVLVAGRSRWQADGV